MSYKKVRPARREVFGRAVKRPWLLLESPAARCGRHTNSGAARSGLCTAPVTRAASGRDALERRLCAGFASPCRMICAPAASLACLASHPCFIPCRACCLLGTLADQQGEDEDGTWQSSISVAVALPDGPRPPRAAPRGASLGLCLLAADDRARFPCLCRATEPVRGAGEKCGHARGAGGRASQRARLSACGRGSPCWLLLAPSAGGRGWTPRPVSLWRAQLTAHVFRRAWFAVQKIPRDANQAKRMQHHHGKDHVPHLSGRRQHAHAAPFCPVLSRPAAPRSHRAAFPWRLPRSSPHVTHATASCRCERVGA